MKKFKLSGVATAFILLGAVSIILNIVGAFVLPDRIQTQINLGTGSVELMNKYLYLIFSAVIISLCSGVGLYLEEKRIRYLVVDIILSVANAAVFIYNLAL